MVRIDSFNSEYYSGGPGKRTASSSASSSPVFHFNTNSRAYSTSWGYTVNTSSPAKESTSSTYSNISSVPSDFSTQNGLQVMYLSNGMRVLGTRTSRFSRCQPEWINLQRYMAQAANEMGLTLVYGDVERTVAQSDAGRRNKGNCVARGGESPHNYGVAADIVLFQNGRAVNKASDVQKQFAQRVKELSGGRIEWGGDWTSPKNEQHHFNIRGWREKYKKPEYLIK